jgi:hypothetical protein
MVLVPAERVSLDRGLDQAGLEFESRISGGITS